MVKYIMFMDFIRQEEIDTFYKACQMHRDYYRGYPKSHHPLTYFREPQYMWQCPPEMSDAYLSFPASHVRYKQPAVLAQSTGRTSTPLPARTLAPRYNKPPCKVYTR